MPNSKRQKNRTDILVLTGDDEAQEIAFAVRHQRRLTTQQRFDAMLKHSIELIKLSRRRGHRQTPHIVKRS